MGRSDVEPVRVLDRAVAGVCAPTRAVPRELSMFTTNIQLRQDQEMSRLSRKHQTAIKKAADGQGVKTHSSHARGRAALRDAGRPPIPTGAGRRRRARARPTAHLNRGYRGTPLARLPRPGKTGGDEDPPPGAKSSTSSRRPTSVAGWEKSSSRSVASRHKKGSKRSTFSGVITPRRVRRPMRRM